MVVQMLGLGGRRARDRDDRAAFDTGFAGMKPADGRRDPPGGHAGRRIAGRRPLTPVA